MSVAAVAAVVDNHDRFPIAVRHAEATAGGWGRKRRSVRVQREREDLIWECEMLVDKATRNDESWLYGLGRQVRVGRSAVKKRGQRSTPPAGLEPAIFGLEV